MRDVVVNCISRHEERIRVIARQWRRAIARTAFKHRVMRLYWERVIGRFTLILTTGSDKQKKRIKELGGHKFADIKPLQREEAIKLYL